jgi:glucokinase
MLEVVAGIDIGGTNTEIGLVDRGGACLCRSALVTTDFADAQEFVAAAQQAIGLLLENASDPVALCGIGIGAPNGNYYHGSIEFAPNLAWKEIIPLVKMFKQFFPVPVVLTNDANAAAIGEGMFGAAKGCPHFIVITLGTGVGSGIVVNGELVYGHDGFAGEIGHTIVYEDGRQCNCGRRGCLETYVSSGGIKRTVFELLTRSNDPSLLRSRSYEELTARDIGDAAAQGDAIAREAFEITGRILGLKLADAIAHTSPEVIILYGGLAQSGELIFDPTRRYMEHFALNIFKNKVQLLPSALPQGMAAILGAAALVWNELVKTEQ